MLTKEMKEYIKKLQKGKISRIEIPRVLRDNEDFKNAERDAEIRVFEHRGFDILKNQFFVHEKMTDCEQMDFYYFDTFEDYYAFLKGEIYEYACYYQYIFSDKDIKKYNLDLNRLKRTHFIEYRLNDYDPNELVQDKISSENKLYQEIEHKKEQLLKWEVKFAKCNSVSEFNKTLKNFQKSTYYSYSAEDIIIELLMDKKPDLIFDSLINEYNKDYYHTDLERLLGYFDVEKILNTVKFDYDTFEGSKQTFYKRRKQFNELIAAINEGPYKIEVNKEFDDDHFYSIRTVRYYHHNSREIAIYKTNCYATFEEFTDVLKWDLSDCDLSKARIDKFSLDGYITNDKTLLPTIWGSIDNNKINNSSKTVFKSFKNDSFEVAAYWSDELKIEKTFWYFGDFVYFLDCDLSDSDLTLCANLIYLNDISSLNLEGAKLQSAFCDKFGIDYARFTPPDINALSFTPTVKYENETAITLQSKNDLKISPEERLSYNQISYITDLHLIHLFHNRNCKTDVDCDFTIHEITKTISRYGDYLLIGGDVSSDFTVYQQFIQSLASADHRRKIVFILGNHELWGFQGYNFNDITKKYRNTLQSSDFYFLQNSLLYETINREVKEVDEHTLLSLSVDELKGLLKDARLIIFGGLAFSGLNNSFNAENGIYRDVISRQQELEESLLFEAIYKKICAAAKNKNTIIFSHMPKDDWTKDNYENGFIYVNGHNHRNYFFDDGLERIYADNQFGYNSKVPFLKSLYVNKEYDYFDDYKDGIYEITNDQYQSFYRARNIGMTFNRNGVIYMLKRDGYYCFFFKSKSSLSILNGGALKSLGCNDIEYFYNQMIDVVNIIKKPFNKYYSVQKKIAGQIKKIGGSGYIHGAIIDIDFNNHIYVNPYDNTITGYFAYDMVNKYVYENIPSLLKDNCPELYGNYVKLLQDKSENELTSSKNTNIVTKPKPYWSTDIYSASRLIKKMEKVNHGILTTWLDLSTKTNLLIKTDE